MISKTVFAVICVLAISWPYTTDGVYFVVIGDWGDDNAEQVMVADAMSAWCDPAMNGPCDFILNVGDNFYPDGVDAPDHPRFNTTWKWIYDLPNIRDLIWRQSLGNHDYGVLQDRELNQVEYGETDPQWYMPWLWYDFYQEGSDGARLHFIIHDTNALIIRKHDPERQLQWIDDVLLQSTADWKFLVGHSPPYSAGGHAPGTVTMRNQIVPLCNEHLVDICFNGDDHNLEHITSDNHTDYVISGAGGRGLYEFSPAGEQILNDWGLTVDYFGEFHGFVAVNVSKTTLTAEFVNAADVSVLYSFTRNKVVEDNADDD